MKNKTKEALLNLSDSMDNELFSIEMAADYIEEFCGKAGDEKPYKVVELTYEQLFILASSLQSSINNIKRVMKEHIKGIEAPRK